MQSYSQNRAKKPPLIQGSVHGRGTHVQPKNRFETTLVEREFDDDSKSPSSPKTLFYSDPSRSVISHNKNPAVGFEISLNPYRGCEHGCSYCFARPTHEYLGFSSGLDFESKILTKENAPHLLRKELSSKKWAPRTLVMSGVTDPYQPIERNLKITRQCLQILVEFKNPVSLITKNQLIVRDLDYLSELANSQAVMVHLSITTLNSDLALKLEPRASTPLARLRAIEVLAKTGVPVGVMMGPIIPGLTDSEIPSLLESVSSAGAQFANYTILRLPYSVQEIFQNWLEEHFPERKKKVLNRLTDLHRNDLSYQNAFARRNFSGPFAEQIRQSFSLYAKRFQLKRGGPELNTTDFKRVGDAQLSFF